jgi:hypothetical protein
LSGTMEYHFPFLSITTLFSTPPPATTNIPINKYTCTHSIHILCMLQVKHVGGQVKRTYTKRNGNWYHQCVELVSIVPLDSNCSF